MPLEAAAGCLGTLLRAVVEIVLEFIVAYFLDFCGHLGAWTVRVLTLGLSKPDPESWASILLGFLEVVGLVVAGTHWLFAAN
ncbi:MAG: hypothetical protein ACO1TE_05035 [Prosthecobacter sp.]